MKRYIRTYLFLILITLTVGLVSRKFPQLFHPFLAEYLGDTMWALLVFGLFRILLFQKGTLSIAILALSFSFLIEFSQFYHAPWIDAIRSTTLGALVLGHGFLWSDILCYTAGVSIGTLIDLLLIRRKLT
jgi:hypothetical protein